MGCRGSKRKDKEADEEEEEDAKRIKKQRKKEALRLKKEAVRRRKRIDEEEKRSRRQKRNDMNSRRWQLLKSQKAKSPASPILIAKSPRDQFGSPRKENANAEGSQSPHPEDEREGVITHGRKEAELLHHLHQLSKEKGNQEAKNRGEKVKASDSERDGSATGRSGPSKKGASPADHPIGIEGIDWKQVDAAATEKRPEQPVCRRKRVHLDPEDDTLFEVPSDMPEVDLSAALVREGKL